MERGPGRKASYRLAAAVLFSAAALILTFGPVSSADAAPDRIFFLQEGTGTARFAELEPGLPPAGAPSPEKEPPAGTAGKGGGLLGWAYDSFIDGASITLGYGVRRSSFTFTRKSDGASGTIIDRDYPAYFLIYSTKPSFFKDSRFGHTFMVKLTTFDMNQQVATGALIAGAPVDVHTDLHGIIAYAVPSLYYQWGEHQKTGTFVQIGAGLGLASTTYSGTIELRSSTGSETVSVQDQSYSLNLAWSTFLEARWRHWGLYLSLMRARLPGDDYDTRFEDVSLYLGYRFFF
jgi:hypothetical protein